MSGYHTPNTSYTPLNPVAFNIPIMNDGYSDHFDSYTPQNAAQQLYASPPSSPAGIPIQTPPAPRPSLRTLAPSPTQSMREPHPSPRNPPLSADPIHTTSQAAPSVALDHFEDQHLYTPAPPLGPFSLQGAVQEWADDENVHPAASASVPSAPVHGMGALYGMTTPYGSAEDLDMHSEQPPTPNQHHPAIYALGVPIYADPPPAHLSEEPQETSQPPSAAVVQQYWATPEPLFADSAVDEDENTDTDDAGTTLSSGSTVTQSMYSAHSSESFIEVFELRNNELHAVQDDDGMGLDATSVFMPTGQVDYSHEQLPIAAQTRASDEVQHSSLVLEATSPNSSAVHQDHSAAASSPELALQPLSASAANPNAFKPMSIEEQMRLHAELQTIANILKLGEHDRDNHVILNRTRMRLHQSTRREEHDVVALPRQAGLVRSTLRAITRTSGDIVKRTWDAFAGRPKSKDTVARQREDVVRDAVPQYLRV